MGVFYFFYFCLIGMYDIYFISKVKVVILKMIVCIYDRNI